MQVPDQQRAVVLARGDELTSIRRKAEGQACIQRGQFIAIRHRNQFDDAVAASAAARGACGAVGCGGFRSASATLRLPSIPHTQPKKQSNCN